MARYARRATRFGWVRTDWMSSPVEARSTSDPSARNSTNWEARLDLQRLDNSPGDQSGVTGLSQDIPRP
jgi:hypothetical protein